jgi:hypothetical protein
VLWGIGYIVCMCIIIDIILILEITLWVPRVYLVGVGSDNTLYGEGGRVCFMIWLYGPLRAVPRLGNLFPVNPALVSISL